MFSKISWICLLVALSQGHSLNEKTATSYTILNKHKNQINHPCIQTRFKHSPEEDIEITGASSVVEPVTISPVTNKETIAVTGPSVQVIPTGRSPLESKVDVYSTLETAQPVLRIPAPQRLVQSSLLQIPTGVQLIQVPDTQSQVKISDQYGSPYYGSKYSSPLHFYEQDDDKLYGPVKYEFEYGVADHHTGDIHSHKEARDGDFTQGEYSLHEADGTIRTVKYTVDKDSGFNAIVKRTGHVTYPLEEEY